MKITTKAHLALLTANIFYAINFIVMKHVTTSLMSAFALNMIRVVGASCLFWLLYFLKPNPQKIAKQDWKHFIFCAITGIIINQIAFVKGLALTTPFRASLLMLFTPIAVVLLALYFQRQKLTTNKMIGLLLGVGGAALLIALREKTLPGEQHLLGDLLIILNAVSYATYLVWVKKLSSKYSDLKIIRIIFTIATFALLPFGWQSLVDLPWLSFSFKSYAAIIFIVLGVTFATYLFNAYSVRILGSTTTGAYIYSQPVFTTILFISLTGNMQYFAIKIIAALLIFTGLYLVSFRKEVSGK